MSGRQSLGNLSATPPERAISMWCDHCNVRWIGCQDAAECPLCGDTAAYEAMADFDAFDDYDGEPTEAETEQMLRRMESLLGFGEGDLG